MEKFHQVPWECRGKIVDQLNDQRLRELGHRLIYLEKPDSLSEAKRRELDFWKGQRLNPKGEAPWLTIAAAMSEADKLVKEQPENRIFIELIEWLQTLAGAWTTESLGPIEKESEDLGVPRVCPMANFEPANFF